MISNLNSFFTVLILLSIFKITYWNNRLEIYDGSHEQHMKIGEAYGMSKNKILKSISTSGKLMIINFKYRQYYPDGDVKFTALFKYKEASFNCQNWLNDKKNILMSPNYLNNINCSWVITANFGSYIILDFTFIEVVNLYY